MMLVLESLGSWLPFTIISLFVVLFSIIFTLRYQRNRNRDYLVTLVCSISLTIALTTAILLPTDVILVSFMKYRNGTFKEWAQNETDRDHIQKYVEIGYYTLYSVVIAMAFLINPFIFFYYEEREGQGETVSRRMCGALKWTGGVLVFLIILIILGIFVPQIVTLPSSNSTNEWDNIKYLVNHFDSSRLEDSISFSIFTLSIIGFFLLTIYTGYGSIACPLFFIRGKRSAKLQQETIEEQHANIQIQIETLKNRNQRRGKMSRRDKRELEHLERRELELSRNEESIKIVRRSLFFKCRFIYRPMQIIIGILLLLLALIIFISLLLSNIDKCIHFISIKQIYAHGNTTLPNPINTILTWTGKFYPINYVVLCLLLAYIIMTSIFGLQQLGIWYFCIRMYRFSRGQTRPQAILMLSSLMMFIVVAINIFVYLLIPQYSIYGDQHYSSLTNNGTEIIKPCTKYVGRDICPMTVMGGIILRFFYKVWFFGAAFFCLSWLFILIFLVSCVVKLVRNHESNIQEYSVERALEGDDENDPLIQ